MVRFDAQRLQAAWQQAAQSLQQARSSAGIWPGELSSSTPATAAAVCALSLVDTEWKSADATWQRLAKEGLAWLATHNNGDGGWGDTPRSYSNLCATVLAWAAFGLAPGGEGAYASLVSGAERWICQNAGNTAPAILVPVLRSRFRGDRALPAGILMSCTLAGRLGSDIRAWAHVPSLPFEWTFLPPEWWPVCPWRSASWAMPLLIAAGQARFHNLPSGFFITRLWRELCRTAALARLAAQQAEDGGFEASPLLTALVVIGLVAAGQSRHPAVEKGIRFLAATQRADGSWPLIQAPQTLLTAQAVQVLGLPMSPASAATPIPLEALKTLRQWLVAQQQKMEPEGLRAITGGWSAVPAAGCAADAITTAEALLALRVLGDSSPETHQAALGGVNWLLAVQNPDGGIPPLRRGWRSLPEEGGGVDDTATALRAWLAWLHILSPDQQHHSQAAIHHAVRFLIATQRQDGSWLSRRFGDQYAIPQENPTMGTARVLQALPELVARSYFELVEPLNSGVLWLLKHQNNDGSWGGGHGGPPSVEETALALDALAEALLQPQPLLVETREQAGNAVAWGTNWLVQQLEMSTAPAPAPVGLHWGHFWYFQNLYPALFSTGALAKVARLL